MCTIDLYDISHHSLLTLLMDSDYCRVAQGAKAQVQLKWCSRRRYWPPSPAVAIWKVMKFYIEIASRIDLTLVFVLALMSASVVAGVFVNDFATVSTLWRAHLASVTKRGRVLGVVNRVGVVTISDDGRVGQVVGSWVGIHKTFLLNSYGLLSARTLSWLILTIQVNCLSHQYCNFDPN